VKIQQKENRMFKMFPILLVMFLAACAAPVMPPPVPVPALPTAERLPALTRHGKLTLVEFFAVN